MPRNTKRAPKTSAKSAPNTTEISSTAPQPDWLLRWFKVDNYSALPLWMQSVLDPQPLALRPISWRAERWHLLIIGLVLMAVYAWTSPRSVALEDDSLFALASYFWGVAHPPGYPLHTALGKLFTLVPIGSVAYRVHMLSAVLGAATCCLLYLLIRGLLEQRSYAYLAAWAYGFSRTFWSQAIIGEVYTLNALFFFALLLLCLRLRGLSVASAEWRRYCTVLGLTYGLSLANHWPLIILSTPGLGLIVLPQVWAYLRNWWRWLLPLLGGAVLPYAWLFWRSTMDPVISFYGPINNWGLIKIFLSRKGYSGVDNQEGVTWDDKIEFIKFLGSESMVQITWVGFALALVGAVYWFRRSGWLAGLGLLVIFLCNTVLLTILLNFRAEEIFFAAFQVYPTAAYGLIALCSAMGLYVVLRLLRALLARAGKASSERVWRAAPMAAAAVLVLAVLTSHWQVNDRHTYTWARDYALAVINSLKPRSDLFINNDIMTSTGYFLLVEGVRQDVRIFSGQGLSFDTRLYHAVAPRSYKEEILQRYVDSRSHPIYYTNQMAHDYGRTNMLEFFLIEKDLDANTTHFEFPAPLVDLLLKHIDDPPVSDDWSRVHYNRVINSAMYQIGNMFMHNHAALDDPKLRELKVKLREHDPFLQMDVLRALNVGLLRERELNEYKTWLEQQRDLVSSQRPDSLSEFHYLLGIFNYRLNQFQDSIRELERSVQLRPEQGNPAVISLMEYYLHYKNIDGYRQLRRLVTDPEAFQAKHGNFASVEQKIAELIAREQTDDH